MCSFCGHQQAVERKRCAGCNRFLDWLAKYRDLIVPGIKELGLDQVAADMVQHWVYSLPGRQTEGIQIIIEELQRNEQIIAEDEIATNTDMFN